MSRSCVVLSCVSVDALARSPSCCKVRYEFNRVLVQLGERRRPVILTSDKDEFTVVLLIEEIRSVLFQLY